jgi:hypothetical protein
VESSLPPTYQSTAIGCFVQRTERYERSNGGSHAIVPSRRIFPRSYKFKSQRLGDGKLRLENLISLLNLMKFNWKKAWVIRILGQSQFQDWENHFYVDQRLLTNSVKWILQYQRRDGSFGETDNYIYPLDRRILVLFYCFIAGNCAGRF